MMGKTKNLIPLAMAFMAAPASAIPTAKEVLDTQSTSSASVDDQAYITGISEGFAWANLIAKNRGDQPLFCQPAKLSLTFAQEIDILKEYVANNPKNLEAPMGLALLYAMRFKFPCSAM